MGGEGSFGARRELILEAHVREGAAHHDLGITAPRAVGVEVERLNAVVHQVLACGARLANRAGRRDVVGRNAVTEKTEHARAANVAHGHRLLRHTIEVGCTLYVPGLRLPRKTIAL